MRKDTTACDLAPALCSPDELHGPMAPHVHGVTLSPHSQQIPRLLQSSCYSPQGLAGALPVSASQLESSAPGSQHPGPAVRLNRVTSHHWLWLTFAVHSSPAINLLLHWTYWWLVSLNEIHCAQNPAHYDLWPTSMFFLTKSFFFLALTNALCLQSGRSGTGSSRSNSMQSVTLHWPPLLALRGKTHSRQNAKLFQSTLIT